eukprot:GHVU01089646.1.p2 GENE.GHVU01089646.1~~GHVU01089646.1.p2  ORF type:complete len:120 (+),score=6.50 GHVU01089646.1:27-362(+)
MAESTPSQRRSGVLLHVTALPGGCGIGDFGRSSIEFIDTLSACKQQYWQVLPLGPTDDTGSPYTLTSCFALNPPTPPIRCWHASTQRAGAGCPERQSRQAGVPFGPQKKRK